jgi:hypothetical protein
MKKIVALAVVGMLTGCVAIPGDPYKSPDREMVTESGQVQMVSDIKNFESGVIKAFPDIPIPSSHKINLDRSVIFTSPTQTIGKIALEGTGDVDSLFRFFEGKMEEQNWSLVNSFQSSTSSLYFAKPGRFVAIIIESLGKNASRVYINVGPE